MSEPTLLLAPLKPAEAAPRLWRDGRFVDDVWRAVGNDVLPIGGYAIVPLARWRTDQAGLAASGAPLGIQLSPGDELDLVADDVARLAVIVLPFPKFTDGRSYSTARRLREAGFKGEIRATGDVLLDQLPLMLRSGLDAFEIRHRATLAALDEAPIPAVLRVYQAGAELDAGAWRQRRAAALQR